MIQMMGDEIGISDRQNLLTRLLDAVKQCQVRFGGKSELATDSDSRVACLCSAWEAVLQHGMKHNNKALSTFKQVTELTGLSKVTGVFGDIKNLETEPVYWLYVREYLNKHEIQRYSSLKVITTESGKGRAWLRSALNEHSLERYLHMMLESNSLLSQFYEDWSFLRDEERSSMLPMMAAGLGSILFAISIDKAELNAVRQPPVSMLAPHQFPSPVHEEPQPVIAGEYFDIHGADKRKEKKKKKRLANIVSFDDEEGTVSSASPCSIISPSLSVTDTSDHEAKFNFETNAHHCNQTNGNTNKKDSPLTGEGDKHHSNHINDDSIPSENCRTKRDEAHLAVSESNCLRATNDVGYGIKDNSSVSSCSPRVSESSLSSDQRSVHPSPHDLHIDVYVSENDDAETLTPIRSSGQVEDFVLCAHEDRSNPDTGSITTVESVDVPNYEGEEVESASLALVMAQTGYRRVIQTEEETSVQKRLYMEDTMALDELKQALITMMVRKDEVEEQSKSLQVMLEQEIEATSMLRAELDEMKVKIATTQEKEHAKFLALQKENELLKHQLRKYVTAVQMLRSEASSSQNTENSLGIHIDNLQPSIPPAPSRIDYSHEAIAYEEKLIQVAEMHGELMEFNEMLHRKIIAKDALISRLQGSLVQLRGPLPDIEIRSDDEDDLNGIQLRSQSLVNVWIPSAFLRGNSSGAHHVYQVYTRIGDQEWNVYRRYSEFHKLLNSVKKDYPIIASYDFPPKKLVWNKDSRLVEKRRIGFQSFLRKSINYIHQHNRELLLNMTREKLIAILPFFGETKKSTKVSNKMATNDRGHTTETAPPSQYAGL